MLKAAISTLLQFRLRTIVTALGIGLSIALFLCLSSLSLLFSSQVKDVTEEYRVDIAVQSADAVTPMTSRVDPALAADLEQFDDIDVVLSLSVDQLRLPWNPYTLIIGISELDAFSKYLVLLEGSVPAQGEDGILIGHQTAEQGYSPGQMIMLREDIGFPISGVFSSDIPFLSGAIVLTLDAAQAVSGRSNLVNMLMIRIAPDADATAVIDKINNQFPDLLASPAGGLGRDGLMVESANKLMILITALSFTAAALLMSNTLIMSTVERTREFGILFAVGWSKFDVTRMVLMESLMVATLGYLAGLILAVAIMTALTAYDFGGASWWLSPQIPFLSIVVSFTVIVFLALSSATYPIFLATKRTTIDALRNE
ncbi:MAG: FtsX-like permease family protein [Wenzhouxiangella sp.]|jgi:putative ABC transport system permease protein|nr:FtsX-like permease family protein [Wenzhouxiangella sp.]